MTDEEMEKRIEDLGDNIRRFNNETFQILSDLSNRLFALEGDMRYLYRFVESMRKKP